MRTNVLNRLFPLFLGILIWTGCDSEAPYYGDGYPSELNLLYSNKTSTQPNAGSLILNYSDGPLLGREAYFEMSDPTHAKIKLFGVLPFETETEVNSVELTSSDDGYIIKGSGTSEKGTAFTLSGAVKKGELTLNLIDIKLPSNLFTGTYSTEPLADENIPNENGNIHTRYRMNLLMNWRVLNEEGNEENLFAVQGTDLSLLVGGMLSNLIYLVLPDVTFHPDGNITAHYASLPDDFQVMSLLFGQLNEDSRGTVNTSPINLCTYYIEGNSMYVRPDLVMIMRQIAINRTRAEGQDTNALAGMIEQLLTIYPSLTRWFTTGICFHLIENDENFPYPEDYDSRILYSYKGKYQLYLDEKELAPVLQLLPVILPMLGLDASSIPIVGPMLDEIVARTASTSSLKLGLYLGFE